MPWAATLVALQLAEQQKAGDERESCMLHHEPAATFEAAAG
jgi:hypothetical protein